MNSSATSPARMMANAGVVMYGCSPVPEPDGGLWEPAAPWIPSILNPPALSLCPKCHKHVRAEEPCPFCLRADLDAFKVALGENAKPAERITQLADALRTATEKLREISRASGGGLDALVADCEAALAGST